MVDYCKWVLIMFYINLSINLYLIYAIIFEKYCSKLERKFTACAWPFKQPWWSQTFKSPLFTLVFFIYHHTKLKKALLSISFWWSMLKQLFLVPGSKRSSLRDFVWARSRKTSLSPILTFFSYEMYNYLILAYISFIRFYRFWNFLDFTACRLIAYTFM